MAEYISERELRRLERQRRIEEEEEERRMLEELNREMKEKHEKEMRDLKLQKERIRKEKRERQEHKRSVLEKQYKLEQLREKQQKLKQLRKKEITMEEMLKSLEEPAYINENTESSFIQMPTSTVYDHGHNDEQLLLSEEEESTESNLSDSLYTILDELDSEEIEDTFIDVGTPKDASSYIDSHREKLRTIERELLWLDNKEKEIQEEDTELERSADNVKRKRKERLEKTSRNVKTNENIEFSDKRIGKANTGTECKVHDKALKREYERREEYTYDLDKTDESESEEELQEKIQLLQLKKRDIMQKINQNKLMKEKQRNEIERKRQEKLKLKKEIQRKKEERMKKLKDEKNSLENELIKHEKTLSKLEEENEMTRKRNDENDHIEQKESKQVKIAKDQWKGKLLKPTVPTLTETTFEEWKIEVEVILKSGLYQESILRQAVRNSLTGQTRKILLTIPPSTTTREIIDKLESVYGNVRSGESVLAEFYMARQRRNEGIAEWGIRLEGIIQTALEKGHIQGSQKDEMLKTRFWRQLYSEELKNATRMYFETAGSFEELRRKVRIEENEMKSARDEPKIEDNSQELRKRTDTREQIDVLNDLVERMKQLETEISTSRETEYEKRNRYEDEQRIERRNYRQDKKYDREDRYYRSERRSDDRYDRDYGRYRRFDRRVYTDNRTDRRYDDRYRERRRYSPRDRRNDRRDYINKEKEERYYKEYGPMNQRDNRDRREQDEERDYRRDRGERTSNKDSEERDYRRDRGERRSNKDTEERDYRRDRGERSSNKDSEYQRNVRTDEKYREDRDRNRDREQRNKESQDKKSGLNSKASLSGGR